jgi:predicted ABC-type transport system involved in lysophospholipase L1 biosynthesis ATPase subunit
VTAAVLELSGVVKDYRGLRPLRIAALSVRTGEHVALVGVDQVAAEVFTNLVTGAILPESGDIRVFGRPTSAIADSDDWLATVDRFGIVSERAVLLEQLTVLQNLAMPFTLEIEPPPDDARRQAGALAQEVGLPESVWERPIAALDRLSRVRLRLGRGLALDPGVLILEHASADLAAQDASALGAEIRAIARRRGAAIVAATMDETFARTVADRILRWEPASGRLTEQRTGRWFRRLLG